MGKEGIFVDPRPFSQVAVSMKLTSGICLTAWLLSAAIASPNPGAKPLTVKAHVGVQLDSKKGPTTNDMGTKCDGNKQCICLNEGEVCRPDGLVGCCMGLDCVTQYPLKLHKCQPVERQTINDMGTKCTDKHCFCKAKGEVCFPKVSPICCRGLVCVPQKIQKVFRCE